MKFRTIYHSGIHNPSRHFSSGDVRDAITRALTDALEALVCPADAVRCDDDIVQFQERFGGIDRFFLKDIKSCALDAPIA